MTVPANESCCGTPANESCCPAGTAVDIQNEDAVREAVSDYYGKVIKKTEDLKTSACCLAAKPPAHILQILKRIPSEIKEKYYGCGTPLPDGIKGQSVLDLGSGSGQDCYVAASLVGENGSVIGIDMTEEQVAVANKHIAEYTSTLGYSKPNIKFITGIIENLPAYVEPESIDIVISNCVVNLSPNKDKVLEGVWKSLKWGGEFYFSDMYTDRRQPQAIKQNKFLIGEGFGGALYIEDFRRLCQKVGFTDVRVIQNRKMNVDNNEIKELLGNAEFFSITYRLFKLKDMEDKCEDYGQVAVYKGTIEGRPHYYDLDDHHRFYTNKPALVCGNTASMVGDSWFGKHFTVTGDRSTHYGVFPCGPAPQAAVSSSSSGGGCC